LHIADSDNFDIATGFEIGVRSVSVGERSTNNARRDECGGVMRPVRLRERRRLGKTRQRALVVREQR
jgi:hypothetical protein